MGSLSPFLQKLQLIVKSTPKSVAGWDDDGKEFKIYNTDRFEKEVLSKHFKGSLLTFIRQLHFYCFKKLNHAGSVWGFVHEKFLRDSPHLIFEIKRKTRTENRGGAPASKLELDMVRSEMSNMQAMLRKELNELKTDLSALFSNVQEEVMRLSNMRSKNMMLEEQFAMNRHMPQAMPGMGPVGPEANGYSHGHGALYNGDMERWKMKKSAPSTKAAKSSKTKSHKRKLSQEESDFYNSQDTQSALHALKKLRNDSYHAYANRSQQMSFAQQRMMVNNPGVMYYGRN